MLHAGRNVHTHLNAGAKPLSFMSWEICNSYIEEIMDNLSFFC